MVAYVWPGPPSQHLTAYFSEAISVYPGSDVRILGVKVGTIDSVHPKGRLVRVTMSVHHGIKVPAAADAVVIAPSVVADRYIQLTPAYTGGPTLADHATIPVDRTAAPVEIDQLYANIDKLAHDLGPNGANAKGALSHALNVGAANLAGNGKDIGNMIDQLGGLTRTLSGSRVDLFSTINNLQRFTTMLKNNDGQVRNAEQQLGQVSQFLAGDRQSLGAALSELATALGQVHTFVQDNRNGLRSNVAKLASITQLLVKERASLAEALDDAPLAAMNLVNAYDPAHNTLDGRGDLNELSMRPAAQIPITQLPPGTVHQVAQPAQSSAPPVPLPPIGSEYATPERP